MGERIIHVRHERAIKACGACFNNIYGLGYHFTPKTKSDPAGVPVPEHSFDLVIGSDVLYEPHLFEDLLDVAGLKQVLPDVWLSHSCAPSPPKRLPKPKPSQTAGRSLEWLFMDFFTHLYIGTPPQWTSFLG